MARRKRKQASQPSQPTPWRIRFWKIAFALTVQLLALTATYTTSFAFFRPADITGILTAALAVNAVLLLPALFLPSWPHMRQLADLYLVLVMLLGIFSAYIIHTSEFAEENYALIGGTMLLVAFTLFIALRIIEELHYGGMVLNAAALTGIAAVVTTTAMTRRDFLQSGIATVATTTAMTPHGFLQSLGRMLGVFGARSDRSEAPALTTERAPQLFDNIRDLRFTEKPNIYFLSFDGLAPRSLLQHYVGLNDTELHTLVDRKFRRLPNFFSNCMLTHESFDIMLCLDEEIWERGVALYNTTPGSHMHMFRGARPCPLFDLFTRNGYTISAVIPDTHMAYPRGRYLDHYHVLSEKRLVCDKINADASPLPFWGYCTATQADRSHSAAQFGSDVGREQAEFMLHHFHALDKSTPQFFLSYLYLPGHFPNGDRFDNPEHIAAYGNHITTRVPSAANAVNNIIDHIEHNDPSAIVFLFGDHGMLHNAIGRSILTGFGALGAIYPPRACAKELDTASEKGYMTILDTVHAILRTVSGGQGPLVRPRAKANSIMGVTGDGRTSFERFVYET